MDLSARPRGKAIVCVLGSLIGMSACEARLDLESYVEESGNPVFGFDNFQAAAQATNSERLVVVGDSGVVLDSDDNGHSWRRQALSESDASPIDATVCSDDRFVILDFRQRIWVADGNTDKWQARGIETTEDVLAITCDKDDVVWVIGGFGSVLTSRDFGETWDASQSFDDDFMFTDLQFVDEQFGYLVGEFGKFYVTNDSGQSWSEVVSLPNSFYPHAAMFTSSTEGWLGSLDGVILSTEDAGLTWQRESAETNAPIYGFASVPSSTSVDAIYAVGSSGVVLKRTDNRWAQAEISGQTQAFLRILLPLKNGDVLVGGGGGFLNALDLSRAAGDST